MQEVDKITLGGVLRGMQLSPKQDVLSVAYGNTVAFYNTERFGIVFFVGLHSL